MSLVDTPRPLRGPRRDRSTPGERERHLRIVEEPRGRGRRWLVGSLVVALVVGLLFGGVALHVELITGQQHIAELEEQAEAVQHTYDRLRVEVDSLSTPRRIVSQARSLGMVDATERTWLAPGEGAPSVEPGDQSTVLRDYLDIKPYLGDTP